MSDVLRRELQLQTVEIDDDLFAYLLSRTLRIGESASDILRRELHIAPGDDHSPAVVSFHIAAGTGASRQPGRGYDAAITVTSLHGGR